MNLKEVEGYPHYYVTACGRVFSDKTGAMKERKLFFCQKGYARIILSRPDLSGFDTKYVHRLVAAAWVPNIDGKPDVNHIDHNTRNNDAGNLEWVTHKENLQKARKFHGNWTRKGADSPLSKRLIARPLDGGDPVEWAGAGAFVEAMGGKKGWRGNISRAAYANRPAYGFRWSFADAPVCAD